MKKYFLILILFFSSCISEKTKEQANAVINLVDSVKIIRIVVCKNKLNELLEAHDPEQLELLLNNFSPAQMAFESEVLSATIPLVVVYYYKESEKEKYFIEELEKLAKLNINKVKFVVVDSDKLFTLAQDAEIESFPTIVFSKNREIVEKITENITIDLIDTKIEILSNQMK